MTNDLPATAFLRTEPPTTRLDTSEKWVEPTSFDSGTGLFDFDNGAKLTMPPGIQEVGACAGAQMHREINLSSRISVHSSYVSSRPGYVSIKRPNGQCPRGAFGVIATCQRPSGGYSDRMCTPVQCHCQVLGRRNGMSHVRVLSLEDVTILPLDPPGCISRESQVLVVL